jgi:hypothetical protein
MRRNICAHKYDIGGGGGAKKLGLFAILFMDYVRRAAEMEKM